MIALQGEIYGPNSKKQEREHDPQKRRAQKCKSRQQDQRECRQDKGGHAPRRQAFMRFEEHDLSRFVGLGRPVVGQCGWPKVWLWCGIDSS